MNASTVATAIASSLSLIVAAILIAAGAPAAGNALPAGIVAAMSACAGVAGIAGVALGVSRERTSRTELEARRAAVESEREASATVEAHLSGIRKRLAASGDATGGVLGYPYVSRLLSAKTPEELASVASALHEENQRNERVLASLSDRIITDASILLPLANAIIKAVPAKTEEAAMTVMEKFMVVREASTNAAASGRTLREALDSGDSKSLSHAADASRAAVRKERDAIRELSHATRENRARLGEMSDEIAAGLELLTNIYEITEQSKLIAFNMSVEAARLGEKGNGFRVIIAELHKLNGRTLDFSKKVADLLRGFRAKTTSLVDSMEKKSIDVVAEVERGMDAAETAVESLIDASTRMETFTREIAGMSDSIDHDLDRVLESLQFQDITRQMIEGALAIIGNMEASLESTLRENGIRLDEVERKARFAALKKNLISNAKTVGEKEALMEVEV